VAGREFPDIRAFSGAFPLSVLKAPKIMNLEQVFVSGVAFAAVFIMLTVLAGLMTLLTRIFPGKPPEPKKRKGAPRGGSGPDQELVAAVSAAVSTAIPGGRVTKIEEI